MSSALNRQPVKACEITLFNYQYLSHGSRSDPSIIWGTEFDATNVLDMIARKNQDSPVLISLPHVLIKAVSHTLGQFPALNCRIIRGRIYRFREINIRLINFNRRKQDVDILMIRQADKLSLDDIARHLWSSQLGIAAGCGADSRDKALLNWGPAITRRLGSRLFWWLDRNFRLPRLGTIDRHLDSGVMVNYLGFAGAPPMRMYKPSKFPDETSLLNVTLGGTEDRAIVRAGSVVAGRVAPLFVRGDHRVTDAYTLGQFVAALRDVLSDPERMEARPGNESSMQHAA